MFNLQSNEHYIRINEYNQIIKSFSDAFEQPLNTDIFIEDGGRHYNLDLFNENMQYKLQWKDGKIVEITDFPENAKPITQEERLEALEQATQDLIMMSLGVI